MKLLLERKWYTDISTGGELYINGIFFCYTLEPITRISGGKAIGKTAIPQGKYKIIVNYSPKYKKKMPRLLKVPRFRGILIHVGNWAKDTRGCILVGRTRGNNAVYNSRKTFKELFEKMEVISVAGLDISITIKDTFGPYQNI